MRRLFLAAVAGSALVLAVASAPAPAVANLTLIVDDVVLPGVPGFEVRRDVEVFFRERAPAGEEMLSTYNIRLDLDNKGTGVAFVPPGTTPTAHPWVFPAGSSSFADFNSNTGTILVAADTGTAQNINHN